MLKRHVVDPDGSWWICQQVGLWSMSDCLLTLLTGHSLRLACHFPVYFISIKDKSVPSLHHLYNCTSLWERFISRFMGEYGSWVFLYDTAKIHSARLLMRPVTTLSSVTLRFACYNLPVSNLHIVSLDTLIFQGVMDSFKYLKWGYVLNHLVSVITWSSHGTFSQKVVVVWGKKGEQREEQKHSSNIM